VLALEKRFLRSLADDVGDQKGLGGGSAAGNAGGASVTHLAADDVASGLIESFAADGFEFVGFRVVDLDLSLAGASQANGILASQAFARSFLRSRTHAPSVLADESVVLTGSFPLLLALAASGGSIAVGPNCPLAEERADSHVARKEPNVRPVAIQIAPGCFGFGVDAAATTDLDSFTAAH